MNDKRFAYIHSGKSMKNNIVFSRKSQQLTFWAEAFFYLFSHFLPFLFSGQNRKQQTYHFGQTH